MLSVSLATRPVIMAAFADGMRDRGYVEGAITSSSAASFLDGWKSIRNSWPNWCGSKWI